MHVVFPSCAHSLPRQAGQGIWVTPTLDSAPGVGQSDWKPAWEEKALEVLVTVAEHEPRCAQVAKKANSTWPLPAMV